jgi:hypothetical protein
MDIERTYAEVSWFFPAWVGLMENHTREMEISESALHDAKILIISPPTDRGIEALSRANPVGSSYLLCFYPRIGSIAKKHCKRHGIQGVRIVVAPSFDIPIATGELDGIYANCFFDCCPASQLNAIIDELRRALRQGGTLHSVHMGIPSHLIGHLWALLFRSVPGPARGFRPVEIAPLLSSRGFTILGNQQPEKFGFPLRYVIAKKTEAA